MKNWKNNILFILGIGIIGHEVGNKLEYFTGLTTNPTIINNINFCQQETELATINIQEAEELIKKAKKETDLEKQKTILFEAQNKYFLAKTQIQITIDSLDAVAPIQGEMLKLHNEDLELLDLMEDIINKNIQKIFDYKNFNEGSLEDIETIQITKGDLRNKKRILIIK